MTNEELDSKKARKDLERWAKRHREAMQLLKDNYNEMNEVYKEMLE